MNSLSIPKRLGKTSTRRAGALLGFAALAVLVLSASQFKKLDHDEHQFIASASLLVKYGLLPWLDYPYFHVPYLVAPYGLLFQITDQLLVAARAFSATCGMTLIALIVGYAAKSFKSDYPHIKFGLAAGSAVILAGNPLFTYTSGLAWNHDLSVLLSVAAALVLLGGYGGRRSLSSKFLSGLLLGLAIGTRLTVLPLVAPFLAGCLLLGDGDRKPRDRVLAATAFASGSLLALLPLVAFLAAAPDAFVFGNFGYPALNTQYRQATGYTRAMSLPLKGLFFLERVLADPGTLIIFALLVLILVRIGGRDLLRAAGGELGFLSALIVFAFAGSLAPTPSFPQYYYAPLPFVLLAIIRGMALLRERPAWHTVQRFFVAAIVVCFLRGGVSYWSIFQPGSAKTAVTTVSHRLGIEVRQAAETGRVLTLAPAIPLEGGLGIYEEFATGPFAWRTAGLLAPEDRERYRMVSPAELEAVLREQPPAGILLGLEREDLERPLLDFARRAGYSPVHLSGGVTLWQPPTRRLR